MISFSLKRAQPFWIYSFLFLTIVLFQRYYSLESISDCRRVYEPYFFQENYIRVFFLLMPFIYFSFLYKRDSISEHLKENLPFFFIGLAAVSLQSYQLFYLALFVISGMTIKRLRLPTFLGAMVFFYLLLPDILGAYNCDHISSVKVNMYTFQTMLETYALENKGRYPDSSLKLSTVAKKKNYWKNFRNPYKKGISGYKSSYRDISKSELADIDRKNSDILKKRIRYKLDVLGVRLMEDISYYNLRGLVLYYRVTEEKYFIYGARNSDAHLIYDRSNQPFVLSNS